MNGDSSLGPDLDPGFRTGVGCGPVMELARHGLGSHRKKRTSQKAAYRIRPGPQLPLHPAGSQFLQLPLLTQEE